MAWTLLADQNDFGIWMGELTFQEATSGVYGAWTIGDRCEPGTPAQTDKLLYKTWNAHPDKYSPPGHHVVPPAHRGRHEVVVAMDGIIVCHVEDAVHVVCAGEALMLPPGIPRTWRVSPQVTDYARGATVCFDLNGRCEWELVVFRWPSGTRCQLARPLPDLNWKWAYVELFQGRVRLSPSQYIAAQGTHLFLPRPAAEQFQWWSCDETPAHGVVVFY